ncbi:MAG: sigma-70 family RNA polymerase sigma factor [Bacteroidetes bacterium]|nr:sigma-70 family RNA polymerase sigma factor [Bacteroidota bacterium]
MSELKPITYYTGGLRERDDRIIQEIYEAFFHKIKAFVMKNSGDMNDAKDVFNKALVQMMVRENLGNIKDTSTFEAYLFTACRNLWYRALNKRKKERVTNPEVKELYYEEKDMAQSALEQDRWELFREKFEMMSDNCREILGLLFNKVSGKEMMEKLGYSSDTTVRQRVFKCKKKLGELVKDDNRFKDLLYK